MLGRDPLAAAYVPGAGPRLQQRVDMDPRKSAAGSREKGGLISGLLAGCLRCLRC